MEGKNIGSNLNKENEFFIIGERKVASQENFESSKCNI